MNRFMIGRLIVEDWINADNSACEHPGEIRKDEWMDGYIVDGWMDGYIVDYCIQCPIYYCSMEYSL